MKEFKLDSRTTKSEIIGQYKQLLSSYKKQVEDLEESKKRLGETAKHKEVEAIEVAENASVHSVIEMLGRLRGLIGKTLNDLTEKMSAEAEKLENFQQAIAIQEHRLKELYDIEKAADALKKLVVAYDERKEAVEAEFNTRLADMESSFEARFQTLEQDCQKRQDELVKEIEETRAQWKEEQKQSIKTQAEEKESVKKERKREEVEYLYQRDRTRKIEEDGYQERKQTLEKELKEKMESVAKDLAEREAAMVAREAELADLRKQVEGIPSRMREEIDRVRKETTSSVEKEMKQKADLFAVERDWERKMFEQKIKHLEEVIASQGQKVEELRNELNATQKQVGEIATKAIEGASQTKAFQSVNQIALEQARRPEMKGSD